MFKYPKKLIIYPLFFLLSVTLSVPEAVLAASITNLNINYPVSAFTSSASLDISQMDEAKNLPWEWEALTPAYEYRFVTAGLYDPAWPLTIKISYTQSNNYFKQIFSYDSLANVWRPLLTHDNPTQKYVTAQTDSLSGRLIVLANQDLMTVGTASWYKYKNGLFAASPDFVKGTILRVHNLDNGKFVDVTINDFGPERLKHPDRVIDLDKVAFAKIASTGAGLINVKVEPLKIVTPDIKKNLPQSTGDLNISAKSAVIISEADGQVLWGKDEKKVRPLASLTKLVAAKVFLDSKPTLNKIVAYKYQDEKYNYEYCKPWESAKLTIKEGETLTIENLLYSALVGSANNAIETLVRVSGLKRADFIAKMNQTVKDWGATNTKFIEPTGLSPDNVSSPFDYAIITKEVYSNPILKKISITPKYTFATVNTKKSHTIKNTNKSLVASPYPVIGTKTGYLDEAGYCLMTRVATPQGNLIAVNFGSTSSAASLFDNQQLIKYGIKMIKK
jgi:D-alanyl-D-alanine endopeptidase (penicillin-binding protein 7)